MLLNCAISFAEASIASMAKGDWLNMGRLSFTEHPASVGETYGEHLAAASGFGLTLVTAGLACLLHGLLPFLFTTTGSDTVRRLYDRMVLARAGAANKPQTS
jgi:hypothetical protein